ncbi:hypothetical protein HDV00_004288 [Rhizophlyctis rosea]|nr:hypothetical protein HDV00_004288 [Rhizophlyctis rosea]
MSTPTQNTTTTQNPSLIHGHVNYVAGVAEETLGSLTGATSFQQQGHAMKEEALAELRSYDSQGAQQRREDVAARAVNHPGLVKAEGEAESLAGKAAFCGGLQKFGEEKVVASDAAKKL